MRSGNNDTFVGAAGILKALGHTLRLEIACGLKSQPCTQTYIAEVLGVPQSTVAQHLKVLRSEGLIKAERRGLEVVFSLADARFVKILDALCGAEEGGSDRYSWSELGRLERERRNSGPC